MRRPARRRRSEVQSHENTWESTQGYTQVSETLAHLANKATSIAKKEMVKRWRSEHGLESMVVKEAFLNERLV